MLSSYLRIETYLTELKLAKYPEVDKIHCRKFSKKDTLGSTTTCKSVLEVIIILDFHLERNCGSIYQRDF